MFSHAFIEDSKSSQVAVNWVALALFACAGQENLLIRVSGLFDDREAVAGVIGSHELVSQLRY
jgi:hypothetical protein